jgi:hypothetical protein
MALPKLLKRGEKAPKEPKSPKEPKAKKAAKEPKVAKRASFFARKNMAPKSEDVAAKVDPKIVEVGY